MNYNVNNNLRLRSIWPIGGVSQARSQTPLPREILRGFVIPPEALEKVTASPDTSRHAPAVVREIPKILLSRNYPNEAARAIAIYFYQVTGIVPPLMPLGVVKYSNDAPVTAPYSTPYATSVPFRVAIWFKRSDKNAILYVDPSRMQQAEEEAKTMLNQVNLPASNLAAWNRTKGSAIVWLAKYYIPYTKIKDMYDYTPQTKALGGAPNFSGIARPTVGDWTDLSEFSSSGVNTAGSGVSSGLFSSIGSLGSGLLSGLGTIGTTLLPLGLGLGAQALFGHSGNTSGSGGTTVINTGGATGNNNAAGTNAATNWVPIAAIGGATLLALMFLATRNRK